MVNQINDFLDALDEMDITTDDNNGEFVDEAPIPVKENLDVVEKELKEDE